MIPSSLYCPTCGAANAADSLVCFACKQPLSAPTLDNTSLLQGRYRILTQVGKGGFGAVYRAEDTQAHNDIVAIKQINLRGLTPQETIEATDAFNREVSLLTNLDHPNLPHIHDNFTDPEHWYLVMDFIEGETLETYLEAKDANYTMPLGEVLALGIQLCTVLSYLHTREPAIIFRDLKPANIMRTPAHKLYLIDFGIARRFNPAKLKDTIPFGSPGYAAPEQYGKAQTTARADIYSLGALLHMLLTGEDPVDNPFHFSPLRIYGAAGLASLEKLIMRMVELKADERPASVNEVKAELQRIENLQGGTRLWQPPLGQTLDPFPAVGSGGSQQQLYLSGKGQQQLYMPPAQRTQLARRKFLVGSLAVVGLTAIGAGAISNIGTLFRQQGVSNGMYSNHPGSNDTSQASPFGNKYTLNQEGPIHGISWSKGANLIASASNNGSVLVWDEQQLVQNPSALQPKHYYLVSGPISSVAWSNRNTIAFGQGKSIYLWDLLDSIITFQAATEPGIGSVSVDINTFAWSPDGKYIAFPTALGLQIYNVDMKKVDRRLNVVNGLPLFSSNSIVSVAWSPDGKYIAAGMQYDKTYVWDAASGQLNTHMSFNGGRSVTWSPDSQFLATVNNDTIFVASTIEQKNNSMFFNGHHSAVAALAWSSNGRYIVSGSVGDDNNLLIWSPFEDNGTGASRTLVSNVANEGQTFSLSLETHDDSIYALVWSPDENYIIVGADKAYVIAINTSVLSS